MSKKNKPAPRSPNRVPAHRAATRALAKADPRLAAVIKRIGPFQPVITPDPFTALVGSIIHQQVSMSAAAAIHNRLRALCPRRRPTPAALAALSDAKLHGVGLSRQKVGYLRDLSEQFATGAFTTRKLRRMSDDEALAAAMQVKGVGRWTAEMLLIFCLERPDVWPIGDLGLQKGVRNLLGLDELPDADTMQSTGEPWRPYRSQATWYLWRSLEGPRLPGIAT